MKDGLQMRPFFLDFGGVHIRYLGNGYLWFRSYSGSLFYKRLKK
ncbi:hypothetical protein QF039_003877 [Pseudomonas sp. W2I6]|nr:hypothetical protein [Pseudomonas sp. W2I6]